jgi:hypothetical protein
MMQTYRHFLRYVMCDSDSLRWYSGHPVNCSMRRITFRTAVVETQRYGYTTSPPIPHLFSKLIHIALEKALI